MKIEELGVYIKLSNCGWPSGKW